MNIFFIVLGILFFRSSVEAVLSIAAGDPWQHIITELLSPLRFFGDFVMWALFVPQSIRYIFREATIFPCPHCVEELEREVKDKVAMSIMNVTGNFNKGEPVVGLASHAEGIVEYIIDAEEMLQGDDDAPRR